MLNKYGSISSPVIDYVVEEVQRQGHDTMADDGIMRVGWMLEAWANAMQLNEHSYVDRRVPDETNIEMTGATVEQLVNRSGYRRVDVWVGGRACPSPDRIPQLMADLCLTIDWRNDPVCSLSPLDFYRRLLEIHPFVDGNGRTGKIVLNWLNGTLANPIFPPNDFWGRPIRNP